MLINCKNGATSFNSKQNSRNRILISIYILSADHDDSNIEDSLSFVFPKKRLRNCENLSGFWKREDEPNKSQRILIKIKPLDSVNPRNLLLSFQAPIYKSVGFCIIMTPAPRDRFGDKSVLKILIGIDLSCRHISGPSRGREVEVGTLKYLPGTYFSL